MRYLIDLSRSTLQIFTFADGLFARLAHDLRLSLVSGEIEADREEDETTVRARVRVGALRVDGVMKDGALRESVLSAHEKEDILAKMRAEVFGGREDGLVELEGTLRGDSLSGTLRAPTGRTARVTSRVTTVHSEAEAEKPSEHVRGSFEVSLKELAGHDIKGPLGAFRVSDHVRVTFDAVFVEA